MAEKLTKTQRRKNLKKMSPDQRREHRKKWKAVQREFVRSQREKRHTKWLQKA